MSSKFDVETLLFKVLEVVQNNLPAKIAEINTEKNDDVVLDVVPNDSYYNNRNEIIFSKKYFIYFGISNVESVTTNGQLSNLAVSIDFEVVFQNYNKSKSLNKVLRYTRALREVIQENFYAFAQASNLQITDLVPTDIGQAVTSSEYKAGGIIVTTNIAV